MSTENLLPAVSRRSTSPRAITNADNKMPGDNDKSLFSMQLPALNRYTSRSSIGSSNSSHNNTIRRPLSNVEMNHHVDHQISDDMSSLNETSQHYKTNKSHDAMQVDDDIIPKVNDKFMELCYPVQSKVPSRSLVQALYNEAMSSPLDNSSRNETSNQIELSDAGLLSLEQVLLPAVAYQEEQMLKEWQSIVQRDGSVEQKATIVALRKAVYGGIGAACAAVKQSRQNRAIQDKEREMQWKKEKEQQLAKEEEERLKQQEIMDMKYQEERRQRQRDLQKKLPANQDVWREVAYLMTELSKLSNEERQWHNVANEYLDKTEADLMEQEKQFELMQQNLEHEESSIDEIPMDDGNDAVQQMVVRITDTASDIALSVERIRSALRQVSNTVAQCEQSRQQLYYQYVTHHQFYGYQGVHDPKGLLKVLSQSQSDDYN